MDGCVAGCMYVTKMLTLNVNAHISASNLLMVIKLGGHKPEAEVNMLEVIRGQRSPEVKCANFNPTMLKGH
jgi:hypothetical protein